MYKPLFLLALLIGLGAACTPSPEETTPESPSLVASFVEVAAAGGTTALPLHDAAALTTLQGWDTTPAPTLRLLAPQPSAAVDAGTLQVQYEVGNYELGGDAGQHVHVIVDNQPCRGDYTPSGSVTFADNDLAPGTHLLTVFLARRMHLSLKSDGAADHIVFYVGEPGSDSPDLNQPTLVYSHPTGDYSRSDGSAANIMLDFYLLNASLGTDGFSVRATMDGGPTMRIDSWAPRIVLSDPAPGKHTVRIELLDADGNPVPGPINDTTRTFTVSE